MPRSYTDRLLVLLLVCALTHAQGPAQARQTQTRPRRVSPEAQRPTEAPVPSPDAASPSTRRSRPAPEATTSAPAMMPEPRALSLDWEPLVRVGLATGVRSAVVSAAGRLFSIETEGARPALVEAARVRVEPRSYPPPVPVLDESQTAATSQAAPQRASPVVSRPTQGQSYPASASTGPAASAQRPAVKLTSRIASAARGAAVFAADEPEPRLDARGPVTLAPADERTDFVVFGGKPYRGRIEVFADPRGTLTVVNVVGLEDYVRGVVPKELSPGAWPELEALKAQAVAARTYAVRNTGAFRSQGFDLLPTTRSQVYGGRSAEHPLADRAVAETHGLVATHAGRPINALYTSTCGGRTENAEEIFGGEPVPYLRARECAVEHARHSETHALRTSREPPGVRAAEHAESVRDAALLAVHGFRLPPRLTDEWLAAALSNEEARLLIARVATLARQTGPHVTAEALRPAGFASILAAALDGESRAAALLNRADVEYLLSFRDAAEVPAANRADVALLLRDGVISLHPDATLRPRQPLARARALGMVASALESRALLRLQKGTARAAEGNALVLPPAGGKGAPRPLRLAPEAFLFRVFGASPFAVREVEIVGGEPAVYHLNAAGEVDYLEISPAPNGAAADRFSKYSSWSETVSAAAMASRLGRAVAGIGELADVRVGRRGASGRVLELELVGSLGAARVTGGKIRTALDLREQLFVVEREYDERGRVVGYTFAGRGWGHGVGMCQVGAYGMARAGAGYEKILKAYYTGIRLTKLY
jgi:stage II sporulation protein D